MSERGKRALRDGAFSAAVLISAILVSSLLSGVNNDNNPFAMPVFILAVALAARYTQGYFYGVAMSLAGVFCVNYMFTYPFWQFNLTLAGYPLTFAAMLVVSVIISALTTRVKRQEQERYEAQAEKMRANLLRSVSHDLRTPLTAILGASSALLENPAIGEEDRRELLEEIQKDAGWLIRVTENILSITRISGGDVSLKKEEEVVEEIVGAAIGKFRRNYPGVSVTVSRPEEILLAPMDGVLMEQVLVNLLENAAAHGKTTQTIQVRIAGEAGRVRVEIEDDGQGFSRERLARAFEGGDSGDAGADGRRGMGIGLSVCRTIILAHGGQITAENAESGGALIRFWLPSGEEEYGG